MNDIVAGRRKDLDDLDSKVIDNLEWELGKRHEGMRNCIDMLRSGAPQVLSLLPPQPVPLEASEPLPTVVPQENCNAVIVFIDAIEETRDLTLPEEFQTSDPGQGSALSDV
ncbi:hypothetical protein E2562_021723 [Oryza meyeriana var. granulata]|uniref:Uncharacterized protein n=1 Tax=Oryza meyeriana var. granulata TaxID=110450 RepID=A0A6G1E0L4_9ORYZ|nr:hypothetical protein E2562_021723 [Oryza meyeriana var. granulata]